MMTRPSMSARLSAPIQFSVGANKLLAEGWRVFALDLSAAALATLGEDSGGRLTALECDVSREESVARAFGEIACAAPALDALVCSAGVLRTSPLLSMASADFDLLFAVNTRGPWLCARAAYPLLKAAARVDAPRGS